MKELEIHLCVDPLWLVLAAVLMAGCSTAEE
jgi:hypothetical protein